MCKIQRTKTKAPTFGNFSCNFEVIRSENIIHPPGKASLLLFNPSLIIKHVLCSKWHRMPWYGCQDCKTSATMPLKNTHTKKKRQTQ